VLWVRIPPMATLLEKRVVVGVCGLFCLLFALLCFDLVVCIHM
jgi:hypothetical protein